VSSKSHATLRYTAMRAGVFAGCLVVVAVLAYAGIIPEGIGKSNPLWVVLVALVISAPLSFVLLRRQRDAMSEQIVDGVDRAKERLAANQQQEDSPA
jgi:RsiW-degrading membrane proteinase PrsW (M82 family)